MDARDDRIEAYYQESARYLAECVVDLEDEAVALKARNASLEEDSRFLDALRAHGVDNWQGYDDACASPDPFGDDS